MWDNKIKEALTNGLGIKFTYCDREIILKRDTTLSTLQHEFGFELDMVDLMNAEFEIIE